MRKPAAALALATLLAIAGGAWATGCTDLASDCQLLFTCPPLPPPMCSNIFPPGDCATCTEASCCQELADCNGDNACIGACLLGLWPVLSVCDSGNAKTHLDAITTCQAKSCSPACDPADECNAVTNAGCGPGSICDAVFPGMFACIQFPGTLGKACDPCDYDFGMYCGAGLRCLAGAHQCARFCCADADCGASGKCVTDPAIVFTDPLMVKGVTVGVCLGADGMTPVCDAPATAPSKGSCVTDFAP
jgi:hypothetical protein